MNKAKQILRRKKFKHSVSLISLSSLALLPTMVVAHPGHNHELTHNTFYTGLTHPFTGIDHLLAMLTVGLWVALTMATRMQQARTIIAFLAAMLAGSILSLEGVALPAIEPLILLSLLVFGLLAATAIRLPNWIALGVTAFFALCHGFAHGNEIPAQAQAMGYISGFLAGTLILLLVGTAAGHALRPYASWLIRTSGAVVAAYGVTLMGLT